MTSTARSEPQPDYLQIYPSDLVGASRMIKIARTVHAECGFAQTHLVGIKHDGVSASEPLAEGVSIVRLGKSRYSGNLHRLFKVLTWQPTVFVAYRRAPLRVVASHNVWVLPLAWLLARRTSAKLVYNPHELETETASMRGLKQQVARVIERLFIRTCDVVSVVNEPIAQWYSRAYDIAEPVQVSNVPTFVEAEIELRQPLGVADDEVLFIHTGHLTGARNIPLIVEGFASSRHHVLFLGDGPLGPMVRQASERHSNIHWKAPVDPELVVAHARACDAGLALIEISLDASDLYSVPNKLMEALAANRPALCTELPEARRIMGALADGWIIDIEELPAFLLKIDRADTQRFADSWAGLPSWDENATDLVRAYRRIVERPEQ